MKEFTCADCPLKPCELHITEKFPTVCPSRNYPQDYFTEFYSEEEKEFARVAAITESAGYCRWTRLEETMAFAHRMGYKKLGIGFCVGLSAEAKTLVAVLRDNGFEVAAASCKCGSIYKSFLGVKQEEQVVPTRDFEVMCNPAGQAELLCQQGVDFCVLLGLCVGHDSLFIKHAKVPVTVLSGKDRVTGHNPMAALYQADSYMKRVHTFIKDNFPEDEE